MLIIKIEKNDTIEKVLKKYKFKVFKSHQLEILRDKQNYVKKSEKIRKEIQKAKYLNKKREIN